VHLVLHSPLLTLRCAALRRSLVASLEEALQGWLQAGPVALTEASEPATCVRTRRRTPLELLRETLGRLHASCP
jgi:hypothetical protein